MKSVIPKHPNSLAQTKDIGGTLVAGSLMLNKDSKKA
jgi:hypothetical protein